MRCPRRDRGLRLACWACTSRFIPAAGSVVHHERAIPPPCTAVHVEFVLRWRAVCRHITCRIAMPGAGPCLPVSTTRAGTVLRRHRRGSGAATAGACALGLDSSASMHHGRSVYLPWPLDRLLTPRPT